MLLEPNTAQAIAVTLHELATNAAKYGALSATEGQIEVKWSHTDGGLMLLWTETGGPPVKTPTRQGFGGKVIRGMIEQLKGRTRFDWRLCAKSPFRREIDPHVHRLAIDLHHHRDLNYRTSPHCGVRVPCSRPLTDMPLVLANGCFRGAKRKSKIEPTMSADGPFRRS